MIKHRYIDEPVLTLNADKHNVGAPKRKRFLTQATCNHHGLSAALATAVSLASFVPSLPNAC